MYDLGYVDAHSLEPGLNAAAEPGVVYQVANPTPTVVALLSLPRSGHKGSLSFNADLRVDGTTPYVTSLSFVLPHDGNSFGVGRRSSTSAEGGATSYLHEQDAAVQDEDDTAAREGVGVVTELEKYAGRLTYREGRVATMSTGDQVFVLVKFSGPVAVEGRPRIRLGLDDDDDDDVDGDLLVSLARRRAAAAAVAASTTTRRQRQRLGWCLREGGFAQRRRPPPNSPTCT